MAYSQEKRQEIYDKVANHLRTQPRSYKPFSGRIGSAGIKCCYRDGFGNKCAIGCLIPDDEYLVAFDHLSLAYVMDQVLYLADYDNGELGRDYDLLRELQHLHDGKDHINNGPVRDLINKDDPREFNYEILEVELQALARRNGLTYTPPAIKEGN